MKNVDQRRNRQTPALIAECAAKHGVTTQAVRGWRMNGDPRWTELVSAQETAAAGNGEKSPFFAKPEPGIGLRMEIIRLARECQELSLREYAERDARVCPRCNRAGRIDFERTIGSMLNEKRVALHRLAKDTTGIEAEAGDVVSKTVLVQYATRVVALVRTLPARLASIMPDSVSPFVRSQTQAEIDNLCQLASEIPVE
jgi:hypothetical protein